MAFSNQRANIKQAGLSSWKVRDAGKTEFFPLPFLRDGKITEETLFSKDSLGRQMPYAVKIEVSAKMLATSSLVNIVQLLDELGSLNLDHQITAVNGLIIDSAKLTDKYFGFDWKFVSDKDRDGDRHIEIKADRIIKISELDTLHPASGSETASVTDATSALVGLRSLTRSDIVPAGIDKVEFKETTAGAYDNDLGSIRNAKFNADLLTTKDNVGRSVGYAVKVMLEAEAMQASPAAGQELSQLDTLAGQENDWKVTFADGRVAAFDNKLGVQFSHTIDKDSEDISFIKVQAEGIVPLSAWNGIWQ